MNILLLVVLIIGGVIFALALGASISVLIFYITDKIKKNKLKKNIPSASEMSSINTNKTEKEVITDGTKQPDQHRLHERIRQLAEVERRSKEGKSDDPQRVGFYERAFRDEPREPVSPISNTADKHFKHNDERNSRDNPQTSKLTRPAEI